MISLTGDIGKLPGVLQRFSDRLETRSDLAEMIAEEMRTQTMDRFDAERSPKGDKWEPSGRSWQEGLTKRGKQRKKGYGKTLQDQGSLVNSINTSSNKEQAAVGSNLIYARIHNLGGVTGRNHATRIPQREYLGVSEENFDEIRRLIINWMAAF